MELRTILALAMTMSTTSTASTALGAPVEPPLPPVGVQVIDVPLDEGGAVAVVWQVPTNAPTGSIVDFVIRRSKTVDEVGAQRSGVRQSAYERALERLLKEGVAPEQAKTQATMLAHQEVPTPATAAPPALEWVEVQVVPAGVPGTQMSATINELDPDGTFRFQIASRGADGSEAVAAPIGPVRGAKGYFLGKRIFLLGWVVLISGAVIVFILLARGGMTMRIRRIAALEAVDEAVGRATEMGRPILFIPGIQDMDNVQTIAGITVLSRVAKTVAEYDATIEVPTARSLAMQASREAVQASYMAAGRSESFNPDAISYITDEQFGFVAYVGGRMVREKPAACFYMGCFFAESLILAETGNSIGAIQIAGTAESSQLPFFVAACDYTLIGEEFFAASAYLSGEPDQIGSIKGQDVGKAVAIAVILVMAAAMTLNAIFPTAGFDALARIIRMTISS